MSNRNGCIVVAGCSRLGAGIAGKLSEDMKDVIFKATLLDYDENEGVKVRRLEDGKELILPLEKIKNTKLYLEDKI